jgi:hypothetical protein
MKSHKQSAFTLVEVVLFMGIILFGVVGALSAASFSLRALGSSNDRLAASLLAQEGLEITRNVRDNNWIAGQPFNTNMVNGSYRVSYESPNLKTNSPAKLYLDNSTGLYGYLIADGGSLNAGTSTLTKFSRTISLTNLTDAAGPGSPNYLLVTASVSWGDLASQSVTLKTLLYDWRPI